MHCTCGVPAWLNGLLRPGLSAAPTNWQVTVFGHILVNGAVVNGDGDESEKSGSTTVGENQRTRNVAWHVMWYALAFAAALRWCKHEHAV